jgi:hypothetical protein
MADEITCDAGGLMQQSTSEDVEGSYETARSAKRDLVLPWEALSTCAVFSFGDGVKLSDDQLHENIQLEEIQEFIQGQTKLPPTYRDGLGHQSDDAALGANGEPVKVWDRRIPKTFRGEIRFSSQNLQQ